MKFEVKLLNGGDQTIEADRMYTDDGLTFKKTTAGVSETVAHFPTGSFVYGKQVAS